MADAMMMQPTVDTAANARSMTYERIEQEGKIPLQSSVMLIVMGSGGCWFALTALVRWLFF